MKSIQAHIAAGLAVLLSATLSAASPSFEAQLETAERAQRGDCDIYGRSLSELRATAQSECRPGRGNAKCLGDLGELYAYK